MMQYNGISLLPFAKVMISSKMRAQMNVKVRK